MAHRWTDGEANNLTDITRLIEGFLQLFVVKQLKLKDAEGNEYLCSEWKNTSI
jgi:hypothetical protein